MLTLIFVGFEGISFKTFWYHRDLWLYVFLQFTYFKSPPNKETEKIYVLCQKALKSLGITSLPVIGWLVCYTVDKRQKKSVAGLTHCQPFTLSFTPTVNLESPIKLTLCMSLDCWRKLEYLERTHTDAGRMKMYENSNIQKWWPSFVILYERFFLFFVLCFPQITQKWCHTVRAPVRAQNIWCQWPG